MGLFTTPFAFMLVLYLYAGFIKTITEGNGGISLYNCEFEASLSYTVRLCLSLISQSKPNEVPGLLS